MRLLARLVNLLLSSFEANRYGCSSHVSHGWNHFGLKLPNYLRLKISWSCIKKKSTKKDFKKNPNRKKLVIFVLFLCNAELLFFHFDLSFIELFFFF